MQARERRAEERHGLATDPRRAGDLLLTATPAARASSRRRPGPGATKPCFPQGSPPAQASADGFAPERPDERPIGAYAIVGDGRSCALVADDGSLDWLCWPDFQSPSVFAALLDRRRGGRFRIGPAGPVEAVSRRYVPGTAVLETDFRTPDGVVRLTDLMPVRDDARIAPLREVLRLVEVLEGEVEIAACYAPRPDYARRGARLRRRAGLGFACETGAGALHLLSDMPLAQEGGDGDGDWLSGRERLRAGERRVFSLVFAADEPAAFEPLEQACAIRGETVRFWRAWSDGAMYEGPFRDAVLRSAITLKLLTYAPSGALVAAATTSLPEAIGEDLNWDYRFCWLRDAALVLRAFIDLGFRNEASHFMQWLMHTTRLSAPELSPVYDVFGRLDLGEETLAHLDGYRGSRPVRVGNAARRQYQLDVYGTVVLAAFDYVDRGGRLDVQACRALSGYAKVVCRSWNEPDDGIWEVRHARRRHTHSALMCWTALDRLLTLEARGVVAIDRARVVETRDAIRAAIEEEAWDPEIGAYSGLMDGRALDAAVLVMARTHFHEPSHPRLCATRDVLRRRLGEGPLLRRYDEAFDLPGKSEGTFGICAFWEIEYLARRGDVAEAERRFEAMLAYANDVGLFAEEIDGATGAALGNFPQAFTHAGLIDAALWIERARRAGPQKEGDAGE